MESNHQSYYSNHQAQANAVNSQYISYPNACNYKFYASTYSNSSPFTSPPIYYNSHYQQPNYYIYQNNNYYNGGNNSSLDSSNNDSAYQSYHETSSYSHSLNQSLNQSHQQAILPPSQLESTPATNDNTKKKRRRDDVEEIEDSDEINKEKTTPASKDVAKRPKIFKLNVDSTENLQVKELKCNVCMLPFNSLAKLLMHQHKYHKNGSSTQCPICYKKFGNQANTLVHLRAHTQEKTYKCNMCDNAFCDSSTLKKHLRTHTGEKPYECKLCSKKFTQSGNLKRHLLVHEKYDLIIDDDESQFLKSSEQVIASEEICQITSKAEVEEHKPCQISPLSYNFNNNYYQNNLAPAYSYYNNNGYNGFDQPNSDYFNCN